MRMLHLYGIGGSDGYDGVGAPDKEPIRPPGAPGFGKPFAPSARPTALWQSFMPGIHTNKL